MKSNPTQSGSTLAIGDEEYSLVFDLKAVAEAEEITGRPLLLGLQRKDIQHPPLKLVWAMFFACATPRQPKITLAEVEALVTRKNVVVVWDKILEAWFADAESLAGNLEKTDPPTGQS